MWKSLLLLTLLLAACSNAGSGGPRMTFADFDSPPVTAEVLSGSSTTAPPTTSTSSPTTTTSTTLLVVDAPGPVAIVTELGYSILEGRGAPRHLVATPVAAGFDDLQGGFVLQLPGAGTDTRADQRIFWSRASNPEAQAYLDVEEGSLLKLWGTELIGGVPQMILTITDEADDPVARIERLVTFDFAAGDRVLGEVGTAVSGPLAISYGGGRFVLDQRSGSQSFFEFRNDQGAVIDLASNPHPGCSDDPTCPTDPILDPSGSFLGYLQSGPDGALELVVHDLDLGEETRRITLPGTTGEVENLDFDGRTVIVNRRAAGARALIVDTQGSTYGEFGLSGLVQFLRHGPAFEGAIEILLDEDAGA